LYFNVKSVRENCGHGQDEKHRKIPSGTQGELERLNHDPAVRMERKNEKFRAGIGLSLSLRRRSTTDEGAINHSEYDGNA
jgi:hypothetical protein